MKNDEGALMRPGS